MCGLKGPARITIFFSDARPAIIRVRVIKERVLEEAEDPDENKRAARKDRCNPKQSSRHLRKLARNGKRHCLVRRAMVRPESLAVESQRA